MSEGLNAENPLGMSTTTNLTPHDVWVVCVNRIDRVFLHKPRPIMLGRKLEI